MFAKPASASFSASRSAPIRRAATEEDSTFYIESTLFLRWSLRASTALSNARGYGVAAGTRFEVTDRVTYEVTDRATYEVTDRVTYKLMAPKNPDLSPHLFFFRLLNLE